MNSDEIFTQLVAVFNALNNIEVKGFNNIGSLAGCLQILKDILDSRAKEQPKDDE